MADGSGFGMAQFELSEAARARVQTATRELEKALFLKVTGGVKPSASVRKAIHQHEMRARRLLREAEALARQDDETAWFEAAMAETLALAKLRGEAVEDRPIPGSKATRRFMLSRGMGLEHARDNGYLAAAHGPDQTDDLYRLGVAYRTAYEVIDGAATHKGDGPGAGISAKGPQERVIAAGALLRTVRGAVSARQRGVLDQVCGRGLGMFEAARACRMGTPAARNGLRGGLTAGLAALRKAPEVALDVTAAHAAVAAALRGL